MDATEPARRRLRDRARGALRRPAVPDWSLESYRRERWAQLALPAAYGVLEGGFVGVIADKIFAVHPAGIALISAAPMFSNLTSALWARLAQRVRKVPMIVAMQAGLAALVLAVAALPETAAGGVALVACAVGCRFLMAGIVTVRSVLWTVNYPAAVRARITSRLTVMAVLGMALVSWAGGLLLDGDPDRFRPIYGAAALLAVFGAGAFSRVRLRGEEARGGPVLGAAAPAPGGRRPGVFAILAEDPLFARYLAWQFLLGVGNMMVEAPLVLLVSRDLGASYQASVLVLMVLPLGLSVLTMPLSAAFIDRVHIARFRARHSWLWVASLALVGVGAGLGSLVWIGVGRAVLGVARSGGILAWQLGHNDFSHPERAGHYMALHVTLTGLRGAVAPFVGTALYLGVERVGLPGIGASLWGLSAALATIASLGYVALDRRIARERARGSA